MELFTSYTDKIAALHSDAGEGGAGANEAGDDDDLALAWVSVVSVSHLLSHLLVIMGACTDVPVTIGDVFTGNIGSGDRFERSHTGSYCKRYRAFVAGKTHHVAFTDSAFV